MEAVAWCLVWQPEERETVPADPSPQFCPGGLQNLDSAFWLKGISVIKPVPGNFWWKPAWLFKNHKQSAQHRKGKCINLSFQKNRKSKKTWCDHRYLQTSSGTCVYGEMQRAAQSLECYYEIMIIIIKAVIFFSSTLNIKASIFKLVFDMRLKTAGGVILAGCF